MGLSTNKVKKTVLVPGWMNGSGMYGKSFRVLPIWRDRIEPHGVSLPDQVVGHSLGCLWALLHWEKRKKRTKLILVNPPFPRRHRVHWFLNWLRFHTSKEVIEHKETVRGMKRWLFGMAKCFDFLGRDITDILEQVPKEDIVVIRGKRDEYFCDQCAKAAFKKLKIKVIEVDAGHDWNDKITKAVKKIIDSKI